MGAHDDDWCILRTAGPRTVGLARSLCVAGIHAWTPTIINRIAATKRRPVQLRPSPILPTFVFASAGRLIDLLALADDPVSRLPQFSVFRHGGRVPLIADRALLALRLAEQAAADALRAADENRDREAMRQERASRMRTEKDRLKMLRREHKTLAIGAEVSVTGMPALAGMYGKITESRGATAMIHFGGALSIEIEAWRIVPNDIHARAA